MVKHNAAAVIGKIHDQINKLIVYELEKHDIQGIVPSHGGILLLLYRKDGLSVSEMADKINRTQPTLTVLVNKLEKFGYVKRSKSATDNRVTLIYLTEKGKRVEPIFQEISDKLNHVIYGGFSGDESLQLEKLLDSIQSRF